MRIYGYGSYDWEADGYYFGIREDVMLVPSVEPQILLRPGSYPTFGMTQVGAMNLPGVFGIKAGNFLASLLEPEEAFQRLFERLNPALGTPREIRSERGNGVKVKVTGILAVPNFSSERHVNVKDASFVVAQPFWTAAVISSPAVIFP